MVIVIILASFVLRLLGLGTESAWIDEGFSIALAERSIPEIIQGTAADQHPPFYYLVLHLWMIPSKDIFYVRFFSIFLGTLYIAQIIQLGQRLGAREIGLKAALLLAVSPIQIWYSQEARMYMLETVLTTAATSVLWLCLQGRNKWMLYGIFSLLAIYTHYLAGFIIIAHMAWVLVWALLKQQWQSMRKWFSVILVVVMGFSLWIPTMLAQARFHKMEWLRSPDVFSIRDTLVQLLLGNEALQMPGEVSWMVACLMVLMVLLGLKASLSLPIGWQIGFLVSWIILPFTIIMTISIFYPISQPKQFLMLVGPLILLIVYVGQTLRRPVRLLLFVLLSATAFFSFLCQELNLTKDDWRGVAVYLQQRLSFGDLVYGNTAASLLPLSLYLNDTRFQYDGYPPQYSIVTGGWKGEKVTPERASQIMEEINQRYGRLWLVEYHPTFWDPKAALAEWLDQHAYLIDDRQFKGVRIRLYQFREKPIRE